MTMYSGCHIDTVGAMEIGLCYINQWLTKLAP